MGRNTRPEFFYHPVAGLNFPATLSHAYSLSSPPQPLNALPGESVMPKKNPTATCIVTNEELEPSAALRFVLSPEDVIFFDVTGKLPGKVFYVTAHRDILKKALWRNSFTGAAKQAVITPKDLIEQVQLSLLRHALETLSLSKKSGDLIFGFAKLEDMFRANMADVYIVADDASDDGRGKLEKVFRGKNILNTFTSRQLSAAVGETHIMHIGLKPSVLTEKIVTLAKKLENIR